MHELGVTRQPAGDEVDQYISHAGVGILTNGFFVKGQKPDDGEQDADDRLRASINHVPSLLSPLDEWPDLSK